MRFPAYVPAAVADDISRFVDGDGNHVKGWGAVANNPGNEWIAEVVTFLRRFEKKDKRIEDMFSYLSAANLSDVDMKRFVNAAHASLTDYKKYRDAVKKAAKLNHDIEIKAEELALLLDDIQGHGLFYLPREFQDVRTLLHETDNPRDLTWWRANRDNLTGKSAAANAVYTWGIAPSLADLLGTVAKAARNYEPQFGGRIGAAIKNRVSNSKTQFLRAFGHELAEACIEPSPDVLNAMACMATVALDSIDVTFDDVKQALGLKGKGKRNDTDAAG